MILTSSIFGVIARTLNTEICSKGLIIYRLFYFDIISHPSESILIHKASQKGNDGELIGSPTRRKARGIFYSAFSYLIPGHGSARLWSWWWNYATNQPRTSKADERGSNPWLWTLRFSDSDEEYRKINFWCWIYIEAMNRLIASTLHLKCTGIANLLVACV